MDKGVIFFRANVMRANVLTMDSPAALRHPLSEGEACQTQEMRLIGQIRLISI